MIGSQIGEVLASHGAERVDECRRIDGRATYVLDLFLRGLCSDVHVQTELHDFLAERIGLLGCIASQREVVLPRRLDVVAVVAELVLEWEARVECFTRAAQIGASTPSPIRFQDLRRTTLGIGHDRDELAVALVSDELHAGESHVISRLGHDRPALHRGRSARTDADEVATRAARRRIGSTARSEYALPEPTGQAEPGALAGQLDVVEGRRLEVA